MLRLHGTIAALAPIIGISHTGGETASITFDPMATPTQISAANAALAGFDWSDAADALWLADLNPERKTLLDQATAAVIRLNQIQNAPNPNMTNLSQVINALNNQILPAIRDMALYEEHIIKRLIQVP